MRRTKAGSYSKRTHAPAADAPRRARRALTWASESGETLVGARVENQLLEVFKRSARVYSLGAGEHAQGSVVLLKDCRQRHSPQTVSRPQLVRVQKLKR